MTTNPLYDKDKRIAQAAEAGELLFWDAVVQVFPWAKSGDFPPDASHNFQQACRDAVECWARYNAPTLTAETLRSFADDAKPKGFGQIDTEADYGSKRQIDAQNRFTVALEAVLTPELWEDFENYAHKATPEEMVWHGLKLAGAAPDLEWFKSTRDWTNDPATDMTHGENYEDEFGNVRGYMYAGSALLISLVEPKRMRDNATGPQFHVELFGTDHIGTLDECEAMLYEAAKSEGFW